MKRKFMYYFLLLLLAFSISGCSSETDFDDSGAQVTETISKTEEVKTSQTESTPTETSIQKESLEETRTTEETTTTETTSQVVVETTTQAATETTTQAVTETTTIAENTQNTQLYVVNTNTKKFHLPDCSSAKRIKDENRWEVNSTKEELIEEGYSPCKNCLE